MCEQTEINYLDGDVVWVKLGGCWWPGQVTGFHNLPEDIQREFQKKPLIAVVKFFQEDTYEYVKNYQQIYKYNCTLKDEFIKKGLDKYRSKIKDGSSYMSKFPGDVEMAEKLTGGDPDILSSNKFSPEEKPDISALFGDKKVPKKRKDRDDMHRRSDAGESLRKITHPRFLKESDHEVRIRQQPSSLPSTPNILSSPQYPCHLCNFISTRVNVIICHIKSHRSGNSSASKSRVKTYSQSKSKDISETPKRKYVKKEKNQHKSNKAESPIDFGKRKSISKQSEKSPKKKKTDPELREKLLADWDDESDEETSFDQTKSFNTGTSRPSPTRDQSFMDVTEEHNKDVSASEVSNPHEILEETEKLLRETEKFASIQIDSDTLASIVHKVESNVEEKEPLSPNLGKNDSTNKFDKEKEVSKSEVDNKHSKSDKDDKKSRLSCFDFDEDDVPEPSIPPVRKIPRVFGEKNLSLKKEMIKEFEMSQALKTEKEVENDKNLVTTEQEVSKKINKTEEITSKSNLEVEDIDKVDDSNKSLDTNDETTNKLTESEDKSERKTELILEDNEKRMSSNNSETKLEIVEILEVEKEETENTQSTNIKIDKESESKTVTDKNDSDKPSTDKETCVEEKSEISKTPPVTNNVVEKVGISHDNTVTKQTDDTLSDPFTTETEDETVSESAETLPEQSESSDVDMIEVPKSEKDNILLHNPKGKLTSKIKRRRGRPRKSLESLDTSVDGSEKTSKDNRSRTSESDTDRSYIGRKRRPSKKYLDSDESTQDEKSIFKTDDSQSEGDERFHEKIKVKPRKGRKLSGQLKKDTNAIKQMGELELSEEMMEISEDNSNKTTNISPKHDSPDRNEITSESQISSEVEKKALDDEITSSSSQKPSLECTNMEINVEKSDMTTLLSESITLPPKDVTVEPLKEETELLQVINQEKETDLVLEKTCDVKELLKNEDEDVLKVDKPDETSNNSDTQKQSSDVSKTAIDMLPPKKSQIKKFELSQLDIPSESTTTNQETESQEEENKLIDTEENKTNLKTTDLETKTIEVSLENIEKTESKTSTDVNVEVEMKESMEISITEDKNVQQTDTVVSENIPKTDEKLETKKAAPEKEGEDVCMESTESMSKDIEKTTISDPQTLQKSIPTRYKGKAILETTGVKSKKEKDTFLEEKPVNTFQEAFLKTLQIDKKKAASEDNELITSKGKKGKKSTVKLNSEEINNINTVIFGIQQEVKVGNVEENKNMSENVSGIQSQDNLSDISIMSGFHGVEVVVQENIETDAKANEPVLHNTSQTPSSSRDFNLITQTQPQIIEDTTKSTNVDFPKVEEPLKVEVPTPSPTSEVGIPVKKREMPRIIENVTLTEPMQILKSKLLDKLPQKGIKHKLDMDGKSPKGSPKTKIMKIESLPSNSKMKTGLKVNSPNLSLTQKLQVLKAEENESAVIEKGNVQTATSSGSAKFIQQSSQSLADMDLDINSMPFVLSEDVLTPECIEQMPVVISSIIPASSSVSHTLALTPTTQVVTPNQMQIKSVSESTSEGSPTKKKSGTPAILKNKYRTKPIITNIRTIVPPLTGGVKGLKFQNTPAGKTSPVVAQKATPGKYVVVHASGGQQLRYSVQGKSGTQQKIAVSTGKGTGNSQGVVQGGKVVIFTSAQSGQTKMIPLNISKTLSGKRMVTNKGQLLCPISPQNIVSSKTIIAPKGDNNSPTTSKLGPKIINTPSIITSKGVLTPLSATLTKTALLGTLSQGILTKGGIYTPISASALGNRIINSKALVTKGATILSSQNIGGTKAILTPISQAIGGKPILGANIVTSKGTVLTPVTGQQVKAIVAKSPSKSSKVQYQSVQQKIQLSSTAQKSPKVQMTPSSQSRSSSSKSSSSTMVYQSTGSSSKSASQSKKMNKQIAALQQSATSMQNLSSQGNTQQTVMSQVQQKGKSASSSSVQKVIIPRSRQSRNQQKILVQKVQETNTGQNIQSKQNVLSTHTTLPNISKTITQHKYTSTNTMTTSKGVTKSQTSNKPSQKNLLNIAINSVTGTTVNTNLTGSLSSLPALEAIEPEKKLKLDNTMIDNVPKEQLKVEKIHTEKSTEMEKIEEPKVTTQPQIMALPTESSDGTQTYVLVTIDEQGQIHPLDNNTLMSLEGTTQNPDGTRTLYIDPSSLGEAGTLDNIVLQFDNGVLPNVSTNTNETTQTIMTESFPTSEIIQTSNQDILAAALANTDFQQEINLPENPAGSVMTTGLTQTSLINQTILQSTIIPPTEPISSPSVLETSLTLNQPIMTPLEVPSNLPIQSESTSSVVSTIPSSLELPITITNPNISYISTGETQIQIPGNSMPDIGEIMDTSASTEIPRTDIPTSTQYLVIPNLDENITVTTQETASRTNVSYSVSLPCNIVLETTPVQTTPSMPIIDDTYSDNTQFSTSVQTAIVTQHNFADVPVSEMLVSKASITSPVNVQMSDVTVTPEINVISQEVPIPSQNSSTSTSETCVLKKSEDTTMPLEEIYPTPEIPVSSQELLLQQNIKKDVTCDIAATTEEKIPSNENILNMQLVDQAVNSMTSSMPILDNNSLIQSQSNVKVQSVEHMAFEVTDSGDMETSSSQEPNTEDKFNQFSYKEDSNVKVASPTLVEQTTTTNPTETIQEVLQGMSSAQSLNNTNAEDNKTEEPVDSEIYDSTVKPLEDCQADEPSSQDETDGNQVQRNIQLHFEKMKIEKIESNQETPSQSFEQFDISMTNDPADLPSQSVSKLENAGEPSQSVTYEPMETDEETIAGEPPTQSFEHLKQNEASQSYETSTEVNVNAPTQSFNELMQSHDGRIVTNEPIDDQSFPTQSYEVGKVENIQDNLETDAEISQEGNIPSQSNDIGNDGIGTSSVSTNNSGLNEDETASSSYVPETPENQERDQDQESAISTSSYEIPPCEELNIASSSTIPDTSVRAEHTSIHDNGVPEIPTSSYNLNPDITSTHIDSVPSSSYEDQVIVEQNVSTSYEVPVSMPGLEETSSQNFVTESTDHRNEPSSYYTHHQEVTASYYESVDQDGNSRLEEDPQEEVTPSYYEGNSQVASQSYFTPQEATPSYSSRNVSSGYYGHRPESEASQSYYSTDDLEKAEQSSSQNIEASQSFYQEHTDELRLRQQGEATPTYSERYPVDYTLDNSPIERHDLVESSVPATKPMER
ncbi:PREDICTED: mucin-17-like isoform X2 [Polistes dominula]|nr:PREDICTED: mucin-17-like isoform X2 [Polistes dominula]